MHTLFNFITLHGENHTMNEIMKVIYYVVVFQIFLGRSVLAAIQFPFIVVAKIRTTAIVILRSETAQQSRAYIFTLLKRILVNIILQIPRMIGDFVFGMARFLIALVRNLYTFVTSSHFTSFVYGIAFCLVGIVIFQLYQFVTSLPSPKAIGHINYAQSSHLYDRNGKLLYEIYRDVNRTAIPFKDIPQYVIDATISIEDRQFYHHQGVSLVGGILRALKDTLTTNELQGGSTITQQLVKTALLTPERTIERKLKEIVLAVWTEQLYSKQEILELYLNQVPYGGSAYGIEEASKVYFGKPAKELSLGEAALLAGLPKAPSLFSPFIDPDLARRRRDQVLGEMLKNNAITNEQYEKTIQEELAFLPPTTNIKSPHFVMYVKNMLEDEYGSKQVEEAGFRVTTTLDLSIQREVERILQEELAKIASMNATNGGVIVMDPKTGEILAMVGSVDYFKDQYGAFNVTTAPRQPGSTLKPMLYAMALENGFTAASIIDDSPIVFQFQGGPSYIPVNYDRSYHGKVPIRYALGNSYNIPAVKVLNQLGVSNFVTFAESMGIDTWNDSSRFGLSLALGGGEVTLMDLVQVYGVFANGGTRVEPTPFVHITDYYERSVLRQGIESKKVLDEGVAYIISDILSDNIARQQAFGANNPLYLPNYVVSAKTGTTNDYKDAWTVGFTDKVVVGVWVGNNNNSPMHRIAGSLGAGPIFNRVMKYLIEEHEMKNDRQIPANVVGIPCYGGRVEYFVRGTESKSFCQKRVIQQAAQPVPPEQSANTP